MTNNKRANGEGTWINRGTVKYPIWTYRVAYKDPLTMEYKRQPFTAKSTIHANGKRSNTQADCKALYQEWLEKQKSGYNFSSSEMTMHDYFEVFLQEKKEKSNSSSGHIADMRTHINQIKKAIGSKVRLCDFKKHHIQLVEKVPAPSNQSLVRRLRTLKAICKWAQEDDLISPNPFDSYRMPKLDKNKVEALDDNRVFTQDELQQLLQASRTYKGGKLKMFVHLLASTGMRPSEALALEWKHVDLPNENLDTTNLSIKVRKTVGFKTGTPEVKDGAKTKSGVRSIQYDIGAIDFIAHKQEQDARKLLAPYWEENDLVIPNSQGGYWDLGNIRTREWSALLKQAGIRKHVIYDLRHTFCTALIHSGVPLLTISTMMGHKSVQFTQNVYGHLFEDSQQVAVDAIKEFIHVGNDA